MYSRSGEPTARVPKMASWSNFNDTRKIKIIKNYAICKIFVIRNSKKQIIFKNYYIPM